MAFVAVAVFSAQVSMTSGAAQEGAQQPEESMIAGCLGGFK